MDQIDALFGAHWRSVGRSDPEMPPIGPMLGCLERISRLSERTDCSAMRVSCNRPASSCVGVYTVATSARTAIGDAGRRKRVFTINIAAPQQG